MPAALARLAMAEAKTKSFSSGLSACRISSLVPSHHLRPLWMYTIFSPISITEFMSCVLTIVIDNLIHEITQEYGITTIINTHDMNSVMEIGEKIVYIHDGRKWWEGTKDDILHADNRELNDFVFASAMAKRAKLAAQ